MIILTYGNNTYMEAVTMKIAILNSERKEVINNETFNNTNWDQVNEGNIIEDDNMNEYKITCLYRHTSIVLLEQI